MLSLRTLLIPLTLGGCDADPAPVRPPPPPPAAAPEPEAPVAARPATNRPPQINNINLKPAKPTIQDEIEVVAKATDPNGDPIDLDYVWIRNGERLLNRTGERIKGSELKKGDKLAVLVKASDLEGSTERESDTILINNAPPHFSTDPSKKVTTFDGLRLEATDPDHDELHFRLEGAPSGMTVDPKEGVLHYKGSEDEKGGDYRIKVIADDGDGGFARWELGISVTAGSKAAAEKSKAEADKKK